MSRSVNKSVNFEARRDLPIVSGRRNLLPFIAKVVFSFYLFVHFTTELNEWKSGGVQLRNNSSGNDILCFFSIVAKLIDALLSKEVVLQIVN